MGPFRPEPGYRLFSLVSFLLHLGFLVFFCEACGGFAGALDGGTQGDVSVRWDGGGFDGGGDALPWKSCAAFQGLLSSGACRDAPLAENPQGPRGCSCGVQGAEEGQPFCTRPDRRAMLSFAFLSVQEPTLAQYGVFPNLDGSEGCPQAGDFSSFTRPPLPSGSLPLDMGDGEHRVWIEPTPSPDGEWFAIFDNTTATTIHNITLVGCADEQNPGWLAEKLFYPITAPFARWGAALGDRRVLYVMADDFYRITMDHDVRDVITAQGPQKALLLRDIQWLAASAPGPLAIGDFDVTYEQMGSRYRDHYAVFMSALEASPAPRYVKTGIYLMDLTDCMPGCNADTGLQYCCKTALLFVGDTDHPDVPTNPTLSPDGSLVAFNRFTSTVEECPSKGLCAVVHVLKNPFEFSALWQSQCLEDQENDGFSAPVDCRGLMMTAERFDDRLCPNYHCCDDGEDCSTCVTIGVGGGDTFTCSGEPDGVRERNYLAFFQMSGALYLAFRSTDLIGDLSEELHVYPVTRASDGGFAVPENQSPGPPYSWVLAGPSGHDLRMFGVGPIHQFPLGDEELCGQWSMSKGLIF